MLRPDAVRASRADVFSFGGGYGAAMAMDATSARPIPAAGAASRAHKMVMVKEYSPGKGE